MKKLESIIFYLLIFFIPVQSRLILYRWTQPFNQWTSAYLYGTDILLAMLFAFWLARAKPTLPQKSNLRDCIRSSSFWLGLFFAVSALSIFNSRTAGLSFYQLLKLAEFIGFYFYLKTNLNKVFEFRKVLMTVIASGLFQSVVAIAQYVKQGSLDLRLLGESPLSVNATGVAVFIADGIKYLRAYGTTPHPNVLAAWLFLAVFAFYFFYIYGKKSNPWLLVLVYVPLLFGLFFTFSRVIVGLWVMGLVARLIISFAKKDFRELMAKVGSKIKHITLASSLAVLLFALLFWPQVKSRIHVSAQEEAVTQRVFYNKIAESVAVSHPLLGIGIGQFTPNFISKFKHLPQTAYQPVHDIYLLVASETGFIGLAAFLLFLFFVFYDFAKRTQMRKLYHFSFGILIFSFLLMGLFDHFLWTLQQGSLMFWAGLALLSVDV